MTEGPPPSPDKGLRVEQVEARAIRQGDRIIADNAICVVAQNVVNEEEEWAEIRGEEWQRIDLSPAGTVFRFVPVERYPNLKQARAEGRTMGTPDPADRTLRSYDGEGELNEHRT